ncbi:hypothetical protein D3C76_1172400 [compost metagenome]
MVLQCVDDVAARFARQRQGSTGGLVHPVQCLVNAENRFLDRNIRVFRELHFQLKNHHQQPGNHRDQTHRHEQQQLP